MAKWKPRTVDLEGKRVGRLTVLYVSPSIGRERRWLCRCDCGERAHISELRLIAGKTGSCGCVPPATKHGLSGTLAYSSWVSMRARCGDPNHDSWKHYGGRGIRVCERWQSFEAFFADMGERPSPHHSIDRIENDGDYEPGNCRWATLTDQGQNKSANRIIEFDGARMTLSAWAELTGLPPVRIADRLDRGVPVEQALEVGGNVARRRLRGG